METRENNALIHKFFKMENYMYALVADECLTEI